MDARARDHLSLVLTHEADIRLRAFEQALKTHYANCASRGVFHSSMRLTGAIDLIGASVRDFGTMAVRTALSVSPDWAAFEIARDAANRHNDVLAGRVREIIFMPNGQGRLQNDGITKFVQAMADQVALDLGAALRIAEYSFDLPTDRVADAAIEKLASLTPAEATPTDASSRLPDAALGRWWVKLGVRREAMTIIELLAAARATHPGNHVSRQRIRALAMGRKPGPKPFGQNRPAELPPK